MRALAGHLILSRDERPAAREPVRAQLVKRGERVKVKVIGLAGSRVSLSLKEVDQRTGADLFPQRSAAVAAQRAEAAGGGGGAGSGAHEDASNPMINPGVSLAEFQRREEEDDVASSKRAQKKHLGGGKTIMWTDHANVTRAANSMKTEDVDAKILRWVAEIVGDGSEIRSLGGRPARLADGISRNCGNRDELREAIEVDHGRLEAIPLVRVGGK